MFEILLEHIALLVVMVVAAPFVVIALVVSLALLVIAILLPFAIIGWLVTAICFLYYELKRDYGNEKTTTD